MTAVCVPAALPEFRSHGFDSKFVPLEERHLSGSAEAHKLIRFIETWSPKPLSELTVLDMGCGRGDLVAAFRSRGVRAFGVEIDARFIESGRLLETRYTDENSILSLVKNGRSIFADGYFDLIISDQVIEHVANLDEFAAEISRLLKPGGRMAHRFPGRFAPKEPHYFLPLVHWLPKTRLRYLAIKTLLAFGLARQFFPAFDLAARAEIIFKYSVEETYYRPIREIGATFARHGIRPSFLQGMAAFVMERTGAPTFLAKAVAPLVASFKLAIFTGTKA